MRSNYEVVPDNPLSFMILAENAEQKYQRILDLFGNSENLLLFQFIETNEMEEHIRRLKRRRYNRSNTIDVCIIIDSTHAQSPLKEICAKVYEELERAFPDHVYIDIYYMMYEGFEMNSFMREVNKKFICSLSELEKEEWIRFVFLVSEVNNRERVIGDRKDIFDIIINSVAALNLGWGYDKEINGGSISEKLFQAVQAYDSKVLTIGCIRMVQGEEKTKQLIKNYLLQETLLYQGENNTLEKTGERFEYNFTKDLNRIEQQVKKKCLGIRSIGFYETMSMDNSNNYTNSQVLTNCFHKNHLFFMENVFNECVEEQVQKGNFIWWLQVKEWFFSETHILSILLNEGQGVEKTIQPIVKTVEEQIDIAQKKLNTQKLVLEHWKTNRKVDKYYLKQNKKLRNDRYQFIVLSEWTSLIGRKISYEVFIKYLYDIRRELLVWKIELLSRYRSFMQYVDGLKNMWDNELLNCSGTEKKFIDMYSIEIRDFIKNNSFMINKLWIVLKDLFFEKDFELQKVEESINDMVDWIYRERNEYGNLVDSWQNAYKTQSGKEFFFSEVYYGLLQYNGIQLRGNIFNMEPYICMIGDKKDEFINYLIKNHEKKMDIHFIEQRKGFPIVLYYVPIDSVNQLTNYLF